MGDVTTPGRFQRGKDEQLFKEPKSAEMAYEMGKQFAAFIAAYAVLMEAQVFEYTAAKQMAAVIADWPDGAVPSTMRLMASGQTLVGLMQTNKALIVQMCQSLREFDESPEMADRVQQALLTVVDSGQAS